MFITLRGLTREFARMLVANTKYTKFPSFLISEITLWLTAICVIMAKIAVQALAHLINYLLSWITAQNERDTCNISALSGCIVRV